MSKNMVCLIRTAIVGLTGAFAGLMMGAAVPLLMSIALNIWLVMRILVRRCSSLLNTKHSQVYGGIVSLPDGRLGASFACRFLVRLYGQKATLLGALLSGKGVDLLEY